MSFTGERTSRTHSVIGLAPPSYADSETTKNQPQLQDTEVYIPQRQTTQVYRNRINWCGMYTELTVTGEKPLQEKETFVDVSVGLGRVSEYTHARMGIFCNQ